MLLITGASGYVGQHLLEYLNLQNASAAKAHGGILPAWRSHSIDGGVQLDLTDGASVRALFTAHEITAVIHLAAEARTSLCEKNPELARRGNVDATQNLLSACENSRSLPYLLHVSTDMVFRGDAAPYDESAPMDAVSAYGRSKAQAEELVRSYGGPWAVVRPALIYGAPAGGRVSVLSATLAMLRTGKGQFFSDEFRTPIFVQNLVQLLTQLATEHKTGVYNAGGLERVSRYEFARHVAQLWGIGDDKVRCGEIGDNPEHAWRPKDISMVSGKAHSLVDFTPMKTALHECHHAGF